MEVARRWAAPERRSELSRLRRRLLAAGLVLAALGAAVWGGKALAAPSATSLTVCVKSSGKLNAVASGASCKSGETQYVLVTQDALDSLSNRVSALETLLSGVSRTTFRNGKDTLQFRGMNVQIVAGPGGSGECPDPGVGNLIVGWDFGAQDTSGCNNVEVGDENNFSSYGLVAGYSNTISGDFATVTGGDENTASGEWASVGGGENNTASGKGASVSGGFFDVASGQDSSVSGGSFNTASGVCASVSGGQENTAGDAGQPANECADTSILGGNGVTVSTMYGIWPPAP